MAYPVLSFKSPHKSQSMVEFALVIPILLLIIYGSLEVGRLIFIYSTVVTASREAARYGSATGLNVTGGIPRYKDCAGIRAAAQNVDFLGAIENANIVISYDRDATTDGIFNPTVVSSNCPPPSTVEIKNGDRITVRVSANFSPIGPIGPLQPVPLTSISSRTILIGIIIKP